MAKEKNTSVFPPILLDEQEVTAVYRLPEKQAALLSEFYGALLDVICRQLLPQAVQHTSIAGASFSIQEQIQDSSYNPKTKERKLPSASMSLKYDLS